MYAKNLKAVAMDMSRSFFWAVRETLPHVTVVFDRFLFLRNYNSLKKTDKSRLNILLEVNQPLALSHALKEQLRLLWKRPDKDTAQSFLET